MPFKSKEEKRAYDKAYHKEYNLRPEVRIREHERWLRTRAKRIKQRRELGHRRNRLAALIH